MKLHLPKGVKSALLACVCGAAAVGSTLSTGVLAGGVFLAALAGQAVAEDLTKAEMPDPSSGNSGTEYFLSGSSGSYYDMTEVKNTPAIFLQTGADENYTHNLSVGVDEDGAPLTVKVSKIDTKWQDAASQTYTKLGAGTLVVNGAPTLNRPTVINVNEGTLKFASSFNGYGVGGTVNVLNGATFIIEAEHIFEDTNGDNGSAAAPVLTLGGGTADGFATLTLNAATTSYKDLTINANARVNGTSSLTSAGKTSFNATLTNDTVLALNGSITVAEDATFTEGTAYSAGANGYIGTATFLVKEGTGEGTKSLSVNGNTSSFTIGNVAYTISGGNAYTGFTQSTTDGTYYVNADATMESASSASVFYVQNGATLTKTSGNIENKIITLSGGNLVTADNTSIQGTLKLEGASSKNTISSSGGYASLMTGVTGSGDLLVKGGSNTYNIFETQLFSGDLYLVAKDAQNKNITLAGNKWEKNEASIQNTGDVIIGSVKYNDTDYVGANVTMENDNAKTSSSIKNVGDVKIMAGGSLAMNSNTSIDHSAVTTEGKGTVTISGGSLTMNGKSSINTNKLTLSAGSFLVGSSATITADSIVLTGGTLAVETDRTFAQDMKLGGVTIGGETGYEGGITLGATDKTLTFTATANNKGSLTLNGTLALAEDASLTSKTTAENGIYSAGANGFKGTSTYLVLGNAGSTISVSNTTMGDKTVQTSGGSAYYFTKGTDTTYYINEDVKVTGSGVPTDSTGASAYNIAVGKTLEFANSGMLDLPGITLAGEGSTLFFNVSSPRALTTVTLAGGAGVNHIIKGTNTSVRTNVSGTGNLTLKNTGDGVTNSEVFYLKGNVANTGTVTIEGPVRVMTDGTAVGKLTLSHTAINNGSLTIDSASENLALADGATLDKLESAASGVYSLGANGFAGTATFLIKEGSAEGTKSLSVGNSTSSFSLGGTTYMISGGNAYTGFVQSSTDTSYHVKDSTGNSGLRISKNDMDAASAIIVDDGQSLTIHNSDTKQDLNKSTSLGEGSLLNLDGQGIAAGTTVTLGGAAVIRGYNTTMKGSVDGTGNLTLKHNHSGFKVAAEINNAGSVTIDCSERTDALVDIELTEGGSIGTNVTDVNIGERGALKVNGNKETTVLNNSGDINVAGSLHVTQGALTNTGNINVTAGSLSIGTHDSGVDSGKVANAGVINITGGTMFARNSAIETSDIYVSGDGTASGEFKVENNTTVASKITAQTVQNKVTTVHATFAAKETTSAAGGTYGYQDVSITSASLKSDYTNATVKGANINIEAEYKLSGGNNNLIVENSTLTVKDALQVEGQVQLKNTALDMQTGGSLDVLASGYLSSSSLLELADGSHSLALNSSVVFGDTTFNIGDAIYTVAETTQINNIVLTGSALFTVELNDELSKVLSAMVKEGDTPQNYAVVLKGLTLDAGSTYSLTDPMGDYLTVKNGASYTNYTVSVGTDASGNAALLFTNKVSPLPTPAVPEPATATLSLLGLAALAARRRRK